jgi:prepilin-type N-terminal cleavage/methylation domain-containing protein
MINLRYPSKDRGFTLIELLVAISITGIVITLTGSGLYALMSANHRSQTETTERLELEQALAFMTDEIKMSQQVALYISTKPPKVLKFNDASLSNFNDAAGSSNVQPILVLKPAQNSRLKDPIVYYLSAPPNKSVWLGPRVIYRWGPTLLQNGNYSDGNGQDISTIPPDSKIEYYNEVLIDRMSDLKAAEANTSCDSIYSYAVPSVAERLGFYACIAPDGKSVKLWLQKQPNTSGKSQSINALVVTRSN